MRIIFVPQFPSELRYQEWWYDEFPKEFRARGFEVVILGETYVNTGKAKRSELDMFSPIKQAIEFETEQIQEYMMLDIKEDDVLFLADISFPGLFTNVLYHKKCKKMYAFCHATSINKFDYFEEDSYSKFPVESAHSFLFDKIFLGSEYHRKKLLKASQFIGWRNSEVTYLPFKPYTGTLELFTPKKHLFMSASRPSHQKVDMELEVKIEELYRTEIHRPVSNSWEEYFEHLRSSKFLLITAHEDTFGYQIVDAVTNNCIPIARNSLAYPELLPREYLYDDFDDFVLRMDCLTNGEPDFPPQVPRLKCEPQMRDFYAAICDEMREK